MKMEPYAILGVIVIAVVLTAVHAGCAKQKMPEPEPMVIEANSPIFGPDGKLKEDLRIEILDGKSLDILPAGTPGNWHKWEIFSTAADNQEFIDVTLYRGTNEMAAENHRIGKFRIVGIPPARLGTPQIPVVFSITSDSIQIAAQDSKRKVNMSIEKID